MKKRGVIMTTGLVVILCFISLAIGFIIGWNKDAIIRCFSQLFKKASSSKSKRNSSKCNSEITITDDDVQAIRIIHELAKGYKIVDQKLSKY